MRREMRNRDAIPEVPLVHRCPTNSRPHMPATKVKEEAQRLIEKLPDDATWDDLMRRIYVRQAIEAGLEVKNPALPGCLLPTSTDNFRRWSRIL